MSASLQPALVFYAGALLAPFLHGWARRIFLLLVPVAGFVLLQQSGHPGVDRLAFVFLAAFHLIAFIGTIYGLHLEDRIQQSAALGYAGSAIGAVCATDLFTVFCFWELMTVTSVFLIWARRTPKARAAGMRYLLTQLVSGLVFLAGVLVHQRQTGSLAVQALEPGGVAYWLIFGAVGLKAAFPGLHFWLVDAYPEATPTGTIWLSAFTTKTAVYLLARLFPGEALLIPIGATMAAFPIFYAVIENDLRRVLAYSLINQVGFMVCGIGIGTALAVNGAISHAFNDVVFKGLLFMTMGAVLYRTGRINGSDLGGLYRTMPLTCTFCIIGAASISAFPLFSGFVSKSMVMSAAAHGEMVVLWLVLLFASAGVFHHAGIKIPYFAFFAHDSGLRPKEARWNMLVAMGLAAGLCIFLGAFPDAMLYPMLPGAAGGYEPYDVTHVSSQLQLLFFSALAFATLMLTGIYPPELHSVNLDVDWFPRKGARLALRLISGPLVATFTAVGDLFERRLPAALWDRFHPEGSDPGSLEPLEPPTASRTPVVGYEPEKLVRRASYERHPAALGLALAVIAFAVLLLVLVYWA
jgi:multicomponent Na+:H+ antiporter subunit D